MSRQVEPWLRSAEADFQAASHKGACVSDLHTMCAQIEDMVQSIALGLNELTEVVSSMKEQLDRIEELVQVRQPAEQSRSAAR